MEDNKIPEDIEQAAEKWLNKQAEELWGTIPWEAQEAYIEGATQERNRAKEEVEKWKEAARGLYNIIEGEWPEDIIKDWTSIKKYKRLIKEQ